MAAKGAGVKPSLLVLFSSQLQLVITGSDEALLVRETIRLKSVASRSIATPITLASTTSPGRTDRISPMRLPRDLKTTNWSMQTLGEHFSSEVEKLKGDHAGFLMFFQCMTIASKSSSDGEDPLAHGLDPSLYGPNAPIICASPCTSDPGAVPSSSSFSGSEPRPTGLGLLHCLLQHFPVRKRLRVSILKIEGLAGQLKPDLEMMAMCKVSIPGLKSGKEQTSEVKRGRDPIFNQEFFFDHVTLEDLDTKNVAISALHHGGAKLGKDLLIGEAMVPLREIRELNTRKEVKIIEEIKQQIPKKLGKLYITSYIEKDARRLTINLKKADDLPRWSFLGAPDVCIKITMAQGEKQQTKSSRVLKSTTTAVYNEAVMFLFNTAKRDVDTTKITISVHDMQRTCTGDDVIGCAYLGMLAQDKSEIEQWKCTVEHMGKEYKGTHALKPPHSAPPVHVAETGENDEDDD
ncbi:hypothetical protein Q1695_007967 [Nippostrongylus brasiliensis]|nr:hypothetical protein Q1695_007967 [Nippostrongylus brasiliensis]